MVQGVPAIGGAPVFYPIDCNFDDRVFPIASKSTIEFLDRGQIDDRLLQIANKSTIAS